MKDVLELEVIKKQISQYASFSLGKEILFNGKLLSEAYINEKELLTLWNNHQEQKRDYSYQLFSLLNLSIFLENNK